jgi:hypothetical protein
MSALVGDKYKENVLVDCGTVGTGCALDNLQNSYLILRLFKV